MAEESALRPATDAQTLRSDGGSSRPDLLEDEEFYDEQLYEEFAAVADERDKKDREALGISLLCNYILVLNDVSSCTSHW